MKLFPSREVEDNDSFELLVLLGSEMKKFNAVFTVERGLLQSARSEKEESYYRANFSISRHNFK